MGNVLLTRLASDFPTQDHELPWEVVDLGQIARTRAKELGASIESEVRDRPSAIDLAIEEACRVAFRRGNSIVLGRLPWMVAAEPEFFETTFRVWLSAPLYLRAWRRAKQAYGALSFPRQLWRVFDRDRSDQDRYGRVYPAVVFPPQPPFHSVDLVVSAKRYRQDEIAHRIAECGRLHSVRGPDAYLKCHV